MGRKKLSHRPDLGKHEQASSFPVALNKDKLKGHVQMNAAMWYVAPQTCMRLHIPRIQLFSTLQGSSMEEFFLPHPGVKNTCGEKKAQLCMHRQYSKAEPPRAMLQMLTRVCTAESLLLQPQDAPG